MMPTVTPTPTPDTQGELRSLPIGLAKSLSPFGFGPLHMTECAWFPGRPISGKTSPSAYSLSISHAAQSSSSCEFLSGPFFKTFRRSLRSMLFTPNAE